MTAPELSLGFLVGQLYGLDPAITMSCSLIVVVPD